MVFWQSSFLGVRVFVWAFFLLSFVCGIIVLLYWQREKIKEKYYKIRWPEKVIKVIIHYPGGLYQSFWRLIPDRDDFSIEGKRYTYSDKTILKENDFYVQNRGGVLIAIIEGKQYNLDDKLKIKAKNKSWPEVHFIDNVPTPINFKEIDKSEIKFSGKDMADFKEARLFEELLTLEGKKNLMIILIILGVGSLLVGIVNLAKNMGWLK